MAGMSVDATLVLSKVFRRKSKNTAQLRFHRAALFVVSVRREEVAKCAC